MLKRLMWVLWPSFLVAIAMDGLVFSSFDPLEVMYDGEPLFTDRLAAYTILFFAFWAFAAASSALTCYLQSTLRGGAGSCPPQSAAD